jgi:hypothetical protein
MKQELWLVIAIIGFFMSLMIGYSVPPMVETGLIGGGKKEVGISSEVSKEMEEYYKNLAEQN